MRPSPPCRNLKITKELPVTCIESSGPLRILIGVTGHKLAAQLPLFVNYLVKDFSNARIRLQLKLLISDDASRFFNKHQLPRNLETYTDNDEYDMSPTVHVDCATWADIYVILPFDALTMSKAAMGICDNLVTSTARAWPVEQKPLIAFMAMSKRQYEHLITLSQMILLRAYNWQIINEMPAMFERDGDLTPVMVPIPYMIKCIRKRIKRQL